MKTFEQTSRCNLFPTNWLDFKDGMIWKYEEKFWSNLKDAICWKQIALTQRWDDDLKIWREVLIKPQRCNLFPTYCFDSKMGWWSENMMRSSDHLNLKMQFFISNKFLRLLKMGWSEKHKKTLLVLIKILKAKKPCERDFRLDMALETWKGPSLAKRGVGEECIVWRRRRT
jgi:hypothetical protein